MLLFKLTGFFMIIFATSAIGALKSNSLNQRCKKLSSLYKGIEQLKQRIRLHGGEAEFLLKQSFEEYPINSSNLTDEDIEIVEEFLKGIGMSDTEAEAERCEIYKNLIKQKSLEAQNKYSQLGKLYRNIGIMSGIFICIFLL